MYTKDTIPTKLVQYKGGGYDGCFWEWNYAVIFDNEWQTQFIDIFSSGRNGIKNLDDMLDHLNNDSGYYLYNLDQKGLKTFANESNAGHVLGVARFLYENLGIELYADCTMCENEFLAYDGILEGFEGCGGIEIQATELICPDCQVNFRCDSCGDIDDSTQYRDKFDESLCEYCNGYAEGELIKLNERLFKEQVNHLALINQHFLSGEAFNNSYCVNCKAMIDYTELTFDESLNNQCQG